MRASATPSRARLALALVLVAGAAHAQPRAEDESRALVDEGREALRDARLDAAARALDQAIALNPRRIEAYVLRGAVHLARREHGRRRRAAPPRARAGPRQRRRAGDARHAPGLRPAPRRGRAAARGGHRHASRSATRRGRCSASTTPRAASGRRRWSTSRRTSRRGRPGWPSRIRRTGSISPMRTCAATVRHRRATCSRGRWRRGRATCEAGSGLAWATAAIDCKRARPLLAGLADLAPTVPAIGLVTGRCARAGRRRRRADRRPALPRARAEAGDRPRPGRRRAARARGCGRRA